MGTYNEGLRSPAMMATDPVTTGQSGLALRVTAVGSFFPQALMIQLKDGRRLVKQIDNSAALFRMGEI